MNKKWTKGRKGSSLRHIAAHLKEAQKVLLLEAEREAKKAETLAKQALKSHG